MIADLSGALNCFHTEFSECSTTPTDPPSVEERGTQDLQAELKINVPSVRVFHHLLQHQLS